MLIKRPSFIFLLGTIFTSALLLVGMVSCNSVEQGAGSTGTTYTAASCNLSDVQTAFNAAANGDTIVIPNGSCTWTSDLDATSKQVTITGQTAGSVIITDNNPTAEGGCAGSLICMQTGPTYHVQLANLNFLPGTGVGDYVVMNDPGSGTPLVALMHDMNFNLPDFQEAHAVQWLSNGGVMWNLNINSSVNGGTCGSQVGSDSGSIVIQGTYNWDAADSMGLSGDPNGTINTYIEDSTFNNVGQMPDCDDNCRVVVRHSQVIGSWGLTHGPTSIYGGRQFEFYNNTFTYPDGNRNMSRYFWGRGGTGLFYDNSFQQIGTGCYAQATPLQFIVESLTRSTSHGCCTSYACWHQPGSGSISGASNACSSISPTSCLSSSQTPTDTYQELDPVYVWDNTGPSSAAATVSTNDDTGGGCSGGVSANYFRLNTEYYVDTTGSPTSGAKPGWTPYTYPHPLR